MKAVELSGEPVWQQLSPLFALAIGAEMIVVDFRADSCPRMGMGSARTIPGMFVLAALSGCAAPHTICPRDTSNLALGRVRSVNQLAQESNLRSGWPSVESGYYFDDVTYFSTSSYDRQYYYDRLGGEFENLTESVRTGVRVR